MFVCYEVSLTHISGVNGCSLWACALLIVSKRKGVRNEALPLVGQLTFGHFLWNGICCCCFFFFSHLKKDLSVRYFLWLSTFAVKTTNIETHLHQRKHRTKCSSQVQILVPAKKTNSTRLFEIDRLSEALEKSAVIALEAPIHMRSTGSSVGEHYIISWSVNRKSVSSWRKTFHGLFHYWKHNRLVEFESL